MNNLPSSIRDRFIENKNNNICDIDFSGIGIENDFISNKEENEIFSPTYNIPSNHNSIIDLNYLDSDCFQRKLVENLLIKLPREYVFWLQNIRSKYRD